MKKILLFLLCINFFVSRVDASVDTAYEYVLMDMDSGMILASKNKDSPRLIASISKIMTCIIAIEQGDLNQIVTADEDILKAVGSAIYIEIGEKMTLKDLLYGMMLRSGNDAAIMVAKNISGSTKKFADLMNRYAKRIGMNNTTFYNSSGLEDKNGQGNISTAYDMALLTSYAMKNKTFRKIFSTKEYTAKSDKKTYTWYNKNKLLKYDFITGGKTGYTVKAKRTLVTTGTINNINLVVVTLNDGNDWQDHLTLYSNVKNVYKSVNVVNSKDLLVINSDKKEKVYVKNDIWVTIKKDEEDHLSLKYYISSKENYHNGDKIGYIEVYLKNKLLTSEPIYIKVVKKKFSLKNLFRK